MTKSVFRLFNANHDIGSLHVAHWPAGAIGRPNVTRREPLACDSRRELWTPPSTIVDMMWNGSRGFQGRRRCCASSRLYRFENLWGLPSANEVLRIWRSLHPFPQAVCVSEEVWERPCVNRDAKMCEPAISNAGIGYWLPWSPTVYSAATGQAC